MTRRQLGFAGAFLSALILTFILRDMVVQLIILPLAYLWWLLRLYYSAFPQFFLWVILILIVVFSAVASLSPEAGYRTAFKASPKPIKGQIEILVEWLSKSKRGGSYYKWLIANRLGKIAREILAQRDGQTVSKKFGPLNGRDWNPPQNIRDYLEIGLNGSFADFPRPAWFWQTPKPTPLDLGPQPAIDYLECEMETSHNGNPKGI
jgi:hypothetical protein